MLVRFYRFLPYRWREFFWQIQQSEPTEVDIYLFRQLDGLAGLVLDVGANRGQFALSLLALNKSLHVLSLEPNTELRWILSAVKLMYPRRYRFRLCGAGEQAARLQLHIPATTAMDLSSNASLVPSEFNKDYVRERLAEYSKADQGKYQFRTRTARIIPIDQLQLKPLAIKVDVEGFELSALKGMEQTLLQHYPLLMIEMNNQDQFLPWLAQHGYRFYRYHHTEQKIVPLATEEWTLNVFCIHPRTPAQIINRLKL